jgi:hypothetical protein
MCGTTDHLKILVEAKTREREVVHLPCASQRRLANFCRGNLIFHDPFQIG